MPSLEALCRRDGRLRGDQAAVARRLRTKAALRPTAMSIARQGTQAAQRAGQPVTCQVGAKAGSDFATSAQSGLTPSAKHDTCRSRPTQADGPTRDVKLYGLRRFRSDRQRICADLINSSSALTSRLLSPPQSAHHDPRWWRRFAPSRDEPGQPG
jgi:hypothetical protein